jgi:hypothetical protein
MRDSCEPVPEIIPIGKGPNSERLRSRTVPEPQQTHVITGGLGALISLGPGPPTAGGSEKPKDPVSRLFRLSRPLPNKHVYNLRNDRS